MRDFFIRGFEVILGVVLVIAAIGIVVAAGAAAFGGGNVPGAPSAMAGMQGPLAGVLILLGGLAALLVYGGIAYLGLGIYHNTRRTAELIAARGGRL